MAAPGRYIGTSHRGMRTLGDVTGRRALCYTSADCLATDVRRWACRRGPSGHSQNAATGAVRYAEGLVDCMQFEECVYTYDDAEQWGDQVECNRIMCLPTLQSARDRRVVTMDGWQSHPLLGGLATTSPISI